MTSAVLMPRSFGPSLPKKRPYIPADIPQLQPIEPVSKKRKISVETNSLDKNKLFGELPEFRILAVRQPWAHALLSGAKKIENRSFPIPPFLENVWLGLYVSKKFTSDERQHAECIDLPNFSFPSTDVLAKDCGKMIGLIRFGGSLSSEDAKNVDSIFTDMPSKTKYHWFCNGRIPLPKSFDYSANVRWTRVSDTYARKILAKELKIRGETQPKIPIPKPTKKFLFSCPFCDQVRSKKVTILGHIQKCHPSNYYSGMPIDSKPAPSGYKYPCCGVCDDDALSICCDTCESWWHEVCLQLTFHYSHDHLHDLKSTNDIFTCPECVRNKTLMQVWYNMP